MSHTDTSPFRIKVGVPWFVAQAALRHVAGLRRNLRRRIRQGGLDYVTAALARC